ncbi:hypothetical protein, partial [Mesorhizobium sp. M1A.F.Ca.IN.022.02.1.1]|uniref:hypothetical protein n=1 Tax=Mesorhizobium sp. M1A.F.Ca.IN.022.02.1.1 TaxID=2496766 RepID=UPI0019D31AC3
SQSASIALLIQDHSLVDRRLPSSPRRTAAPIDISARQRPEQEHRLGAPVYVLQPENLGHIR